VLSVFDHRPTRPATGGRVFTAADNRGAAKVMVVNETAARVRQRPLGFRSAGRCQSIR